MALSFGLLAQAPLILSASQNYIQKVKQKKDRPEMSIPAKITIASVTILTSLTLIYIIINKYSSSRKDDSTQNESSSQQNILDSNNTNDLIKDNQNNNISNQSSNNQQEDSKSIISNSEEDNAKSDALMMPYTEEEVEPKVGRKGEKERPIQLNEKDNELNTTQEEAPKPFVMPKTVGEEKPEVGEQEVIHKPINKKENNDYTITDEQDVNYNSYEGNISISEMEISQESDEHSDNLP